MPAKTTCSTNQSRKPIPDRWARQPTRVPRQVWPEANPRLHSCWVQLHNIPKDFIRHSIITRVARANFSAFYSYDPYVVSLFGGKRFITFKYENLGSLCYRCGMVGHLIGGCPLEIRDCEGIELPHHTGYGHWMEPCHFEGRFWLYRIHPVVMDYDYGESIGDSGISVVQSRHGNGS
ncbi:hypothetical protein Tsubulata_043296 [Turnera subulata]|uniref:CCHC-type domain-containing protein n=1 Tax=Turnera subulata TaxID=218843 RepID=A0A9Q0JAN9_9ROSI|nr:hypothetical protein Tsubulata_043296 [Turnera subulata]